MKKMRIEALLLHTQNMKRNSVKKNNNEQDVGFKICNRLFYLVKHFNVVLDIFYFIDDRKVN